MSAQACQCGSAPKIIYACSGSSDVGEMSDRVARMLTRQGHGKMSCLVGIGGRVSGHLKTAEAASAILAIDGCPLNCAQKCLELAGFSGFAHLQLADLGLERGESPVTEETVARVTARAAEMLAAAR